jgi:hypothetical protein
VAIVTQDVSPSPSSEAGRMKRCELVFPSTVCTPQLQLWQNRPIAVWAAGCGLIWATFVQRRCYNRCQLPVQAAGN